MGTDYRRTVKAYYVEDDVPYISTIDDEQGQNLRGEGWHVKLQPLWFSVSLFVKQGDWVL